MSIARISIIIEPIEFSIVWKLLIGSWMVLGYLVLISKFGFRLFSYFLYSLEYIALRYYKILAFCLYDSLILEFKVILTRGLLWSKVNYKFHFSFTSSFASRALFFEGEGR